MARLGAQPSCSRMDHALDASGSNSLFFRLAPSLCTAFNGVENKVDPMLDVMYRAESGRTVFSSFDAWSLHRSCCT